MTETTDTDLPTLPFDKPDLLRIAPTMRALQERAPISRVRTATGDEAWLVTHYEQARALFGDPRLGRSHPKPAEAARISASPLIGGAADNYDTEDADHNRMRARLVPCFSARRMKALAPRVAELLDGLLVDLAGRTPPVDLHQALSFPLPVLVICELLGVPYADRAQFHTWSTGMADATDTEHANNSRLAMFGYLRELVVRKRTEPGDDIITELIGMENGAMSDDEVAGLATIVLFAGHETTVTRIDMGVLRLLTNPDQRAALLADPDLVPAAVEEILRLGVGGTGQAGLPRYARTDIEIGGVTIRTGDAVLLASGVANQDPAAFADPDRFDIGRPQPISHLTFGHGARYCIGASLARIELTTVFGALFQRFPGMELAVPVERLRWRTNVITGGFAELPVTWTT
jgi:pentalenolactone synthase